MKTFRTRYNQLSVWQSVDRAPNEAIVVAIPYSAPSEGMDVTKAYLTIEQARELSLELDQLLARIDERRKETAWATIGEDQ